MRDAGDGAEGAGLAGVEGGAAGAREAVGAIDLADGKEAVDVGLVPDVAGEAPVIVLGADRNLEGFAAQVNIVTQIQVDGRLI